MDSGWFILYLYNLVRASKYVLVTTGSIYFVYNMFYQVATFSIFMFWILPEVYIWFNSFFQVITSIIWLVPVSSGDYP